jgi:YggT family protein
MATTSPGAAPLRKSGFRAAPNAVVVTESSVPRARLPPMTAVPPAADAPRKQAAMYALLNLIDSAISIYIWLLIASVVLTWLVAFNVINTRNRFVYAVGDFLHRVTEPALRPIRNVMPNLGGIDISPVILILLLYFVRDLLFEIFAR